MRFVWGNVCFWKWNLQYCWRWALALENTIVDPVGSHWNYVLFNYFFNNFKKTSLQQNMFFFKVFFLNHSTFLTNDVVLGKDNGGSRLGPWGMWPPTVSISRTCCPGVRWYAISPRCGRGQVLIKQARGSFPMGGGKLWQTAGANDYPCAYRRKKWGHGKSNKPGGYFDWSGLFVFVFFVRAEERV